MAAQFKAFLDSTGGLWRAQTLGGKPAGIFYSTGCQGGGQETTPFAAITQLAHHGMIFVPIGYTAGAGMFEIEKVKAGSPYGAGIYAGDGSRRPSELELRLAFHQGKYIACIAKMLKGSADTHSKINLRTAAEDQVNREVRGMGEIDSRTLAKGNDGEVRSEYLT